MNYKTISKLCLILPLVWAALVIGAIHSCAVSEATYIEIGKQSMSKQDFKKAKKYFDKVLKSNDNVEAYLLRARCFVEEDKFRLALKDYTKAIEIKPIGDNYYLRACVYFIDSQDSLAKFDFKKACALNHVKSCDLVKQYFK